MEKAAGWALGAVESEEARSKCCQSPFFTDREAIASTNFLSLEMFSFENMHAPTGSRVLDFRQSSWTRGETSANKC